MIGWNSLSHNPLALFVNIMPREAPGPAINNLSRIRGLNQGPVKTATGMRVIDLTVVVTQALRQQQRLERLRDGNEWEDSGLVFTTRQGKWLDPQIVYRDFKLVLKKAGLPSSIRLHDLRHAMATH